MGDHIRHFKMLRSQIFFWVIGTVSKILFLIYIKQILYISKLRMEILSRNFDCNNISCRKHEYWNIFLKSWRIGPMNQVPVLLVCWSGLWVICYLRFDIRFGSTLIVKNLHEPMKLLGWKECFSKLQTPIAQISGRISHKSNLSN
jgi:hypothetical protein